jgi:hypothetical protein
MHESIERVRLDAAKCRELANTAVTSNGREVLTELAERYEEKAVILERSKQRRPTRSPFRWSIS